ncbi:MAG TPA: rod shape-determining protein MreD [Phycisphaerae bacterium]|nr:rod shape-determining protein MreD [Phycisphaerae bacterium]
MRWITFFILLFLADALQQSHFASIPHPSHTDPWPSIEYLPLLAIFYALFASEAAAPLGGLCCGIAYDLANHTDFVGTSAVPLALTAWLVVRIRLSIFREHFVSQLLITLMAILTFALLCLMMRSIAHAPFEGQSLWTHFMTLAGNAIYTALVAPAFFWLFFRFPGLLGFTSHGPRTRHG